MIEQLFSSLGRLSLLEVQQAYHADGCTEIGKGIIRLIQVVEAGIPTSGGKYRYERYCFTAYFLSLAIATET